MIKGTFVFIITLLLIGMFTHSSLATTKNVATRATSPAITSKEEGYFFGKNDKSWAKVITEQQDKVTVYSVPERPKKVSSDDAKKLYLEEKSQIDYKECKTKYLGFTQGIKTLTTCVNQTASLKAKKSLKIQLSKSTTSHPPAGRRWFVWPMICVVGILSLALIFIARGASAMFFVQYGEWLMWSLAGEAVIVFWIDNIFVQIIIACIVFAITLFYGYRCHIGKWCTKKPILSVETVVSEILQTLWIFGGCLVINVMFAVIPDITVQVDFAFFIFGWLVCATIGIFVASQFPNFAKKYLSWI